MLHALHKLTIEGQTFSCDKKKKTSNLKTKQQKTDTTMTRQTKYDKNRIIMEAGKSELNHEIQKIILKNENQNTATDIQKQAEKSKSKKEAADKKNAEREKKLLENKLCKTSDKIQVVNPAIYNKFTKTPTSTTSTFGRTTKVRKKIRDDFNIFEFIKERRRTKKPVKNVNRFKEPKVFKGKKREVRRPRTYKTPLRRKILEYRINNITKSACEQTLEEGAVERTKDYIKESETHVESTDSLQKCDITPLLEKLKLDEETSPLNKTIHSRKFRSYCNNTTSKELSELCEDLVKGLFRFQKRAFERDELKAKSHRRYVVGFKEVLRKLEINKIKLVIITTDCEKCDLPGGIDDIVQQIKEKCDTNNAAYIFSLNRRHLGYFLCKKVPVSCIGVLFYDGLEQTVNALKENVVRERKKYIELTR